MRRLSVIRYAVLIAVRDVLVPVAGLVLALALPLTGRLEPWHLPLIAGMIGTPLVGRGEAPPEVPTPPVPSELPSPDPSPEPSSRRG